MAASTAGNRAAKPVMPVIVVALAASLFAALLAMTAPSAAAQLLTCGGKSVTINMNLNGGSGRTAVGTDGDDVILGRPGNDIIRAGGGNDTICGGDGNDRILGEAGDDHILGGAAIDYLFGGPGNDTIEGEGGSDRMYGNDGADDMSGGSGADRMWGGNGDDILRGQGGQDRMWGESGNDKMQGNWQSDLIRGGDGDDEIGGAEGRDQLYGDGGDDAIFGGDNGDTIHGGPDNDFIGGGNGLDMLSGGAHADFMNGGPNSDTCDRGAGDWLSSCQQRTWGVDDAWHLTEAEIDGQVTSYEANDGRIKIDASTRSFSASSGCNSGGGTVDVDGNAISVSVQTITQAVCNGTLGEIDGLLFTVIGEMTELLSTGTTLTLRSSTGARSMTFTRLPAKKLTTISPLGDWTLTSGTHNACHGAADCLAPDLVIEPLSVGAITLTIDETTVSGSGGCNGYQGTRDLSVPFGVTELITTLIGCPTDVSEVEGLYLEALSDVTDIEFSTTTLRLTGPGAVLEFVR